MSDELFKTWLKSKYYEVLSDWINTIRAGQGDSAFEPPSTALLDAYEVVLAHLGVSIR